MPSTLSIPDDPLFKYQWGLLNTGQAHGGKGVDIDVVPVWPDYTGTGIKVGVIDDGTQLDQPDLVANIKYAYDATIDGPGGGPVTDDQDHGTATAGIIAAAANNGIGGSGVAPAASLGIYRIAFGRDARTADPQQYHNAFEKALSDGMDVVNNSWGSSHPFARLSDDGIEDLAEKGRGGLGSVVVFSNGNERAKDSDGILNLTKNSPDVIAVAAIDNNGVASRYSTPGANLLVSAPGGASTPQRATVPGNGIVTTDRTGEDGYNTSEGTAGDYTFDFSGTSAAAPFVSGVAALVLQADPELNYREVQQVLAKTAHMNDASGRGWRSTNSGDWNGGGSEYNRDYGFGLVDARAAVRLAESYVGRSVLGTSTDDLSTVSPASPVTIPRGQKAISFRFNIGKAIDVEHISLFLDLNVAKTSDITVSLTSPAGGKILLLQGSDDKTATPWPANGFVLTSPAFWGTNGAGTWTLSIVSRDHDLDPSVVQQFVDAKLAVQGTSIGTAAPEEITYTDDFAALAAEDPSRLVVSATGAPETINASPVSGAVVLDMPAHTLSVDGESAVINPAAQIGTIYGGDGDDSFTGDASDMVFSPGRGHNTVTGGGGNDTVQLLNALSGYSEMRHGASVILTGTESQDTLSGIGTLQFRGGSLSLGSNPLINDVYYDQANPDVYAAGVSAGSHYDAYGWHEGRNPDALFSTASFLVNYKDAAASGENPLTYYDTVGWKNGDNPSADFDTNLYLTHNPDVVAAGMDPLQHYLAYGWKEGRDPSAAFSTQGYLSANPDVKAAGMDPLVHFLQSGAMEGRSAIPVG